jgi:GNAT superfamily N-acetyltransferase
MAAIERMPRIEGISPEAADMAVALSCEAGWNQVAADWRVMLAHGNGFAARAADGSLAGSALVLPLGPEIAWVSMVLVTAAQRRRGLGTQLLARCLAACAEHGLVAGLDATELGRPVYAQLGFRDVYALRRWRLARAMPFGAVGAGTDILLAPITPADLPEIAAFDAARSPFAREALLAQLALRGPALTARDRAGTLRGFALSRNGRLATQIGPILATTPDIALALLAGVSARVAPPYVLDVPEGQAKFAAALRAEGADSARGFMRMVRGAPGRLAAWNDLHAIAGPELG